MRVYKAKRHLKRKRTDIKFDRPRKHSRNRRGIPTTFVRVNRNTYHRLLAWARQRGFRG